MIGGRWVDRDEKIEVRDPFDDSLVDTVPSANEKDVLSAIESAERGFQVMRRLPTHQRVTILRKTADILADNKEKFARTIAREGSKTIREARKEAFRCSNTLHVAADEARKILGETINFDAVPGSENRVGYYYRFPIGIIAAITPFNDPLNLVAHKLGPAFAGGNAVVLKPASVTPLSALLLAEAFLEAGLPPEALQVVTGRGEAIGDVLVTDPRIRMISFTGGPEAGEAITHKAGLKKIGMELGSNSPVIVCADADFDLAVDCTVSGAFWAAGQNCIGVQRVYVEKTIFAKFVDAFVARTKKYKVGPKLDEDCDMGPMIAEKEAIRIEAWVNDAVKAGAKLLAGGKRRGAVYEPTVLVDVPEGARVGCEEVFAPVVSLYPVEDLEEAVRRSNEPDYGLLAGIFTSSLEKAFYAIREMDVGGIVVNDSSDYRVDQMPFGGVKRSGLGREGIEFALLEMTEPKMVCFNLQGIKR
ncbi:MAG: aldehyde dehydrogenase family protein [Candidatus Latescibacterota bacterium]|nr:MAG: aldehyde dehydrogenase family protein [Candidatus Latescibacterota bacterium]